MNKKNILKAVIAVAITMAFAMPVTAFANMGTIKVTSDGKNTIDINSSNRGGTIPSDTPTEDTIVAEKTASTTMSITRGTIYVDDNQIPGWYDHTHVKTIHEGVNNATAGDTVYVYNGTYFDHVTVNKKLSLIGENRQSVIVDGSGTGNVMYVTEKQVNISAFTIKRGNYGIYLFSSSNNNSIQNCDIYSCSGNGIYLSYSAYNSITNCHVYNNGYGIRISASPHNNIINCEMNNSAYGLQLDSITSSVSWYNNITNCNIHHTSMQGVRFTEYSRYNNMNDCNIYNNRNQGIYLYKASYNTFTNCNVYNNRDDGIYVSFYPSEQDSFIDCNIYNNTLYGFHTYSSVSGFSVINCNIYDNQGGGIQLGISQNGQLSGNTLYNNNINLLVIGSSLNSYYHNIDPSNTIDGKSIYYLVNQTNILLDENNHFGYLGLISCTNITAKNSVVNGILLANTGHSTINNVSSHNNQIGIFLTSSSSNNNIINCDAYNNTQQGIMLYYSNNNNLTDCNAYNNMGTGIRVFSSQHINLVNCDAYNTVVMPGFGYGYGIILESASNYNNIIDCNAYNNANTGITLTSNNNLIGCDAHNNIGNGINLGSNNNITNSESYSNNGYGISLGSNNNITNCQIHDNSKTGVYLFNSNNNKISSCNVYNNDNYGINIKTSSNSILRGNAFHDNVYNFGVEGTTVSHFTQDIDISNTVNGKIIYFLVGQSDLILDETDNVGYLGLISCTNILAKNSDVSGILMFNTAYSTISNVSSHDSEKGIYLLSSSNNNFTNCEAYDNTNYGIYLDVSPNNKLRGNAFHDNAYNFGVVGSYVQDIDISNTINGKIIYYLVGQSDLILDETDNVGYLGLISCTSITVKNSDTFGVLLIDTVDSTFINVSSHNTIGGFFISNSDNNNLSDCIAYNNTQGIRLLDSSDNTIINCFSYNNGVGISLEGHPTNNNIMHSAFYNNTGYGIALATDALEIGNYFTNCRSNNNGGGISIYGYLTIVTGCSFTDNLGNGIYFDIPPWGGNDGNEITNSDSFNNGCGIYVNYQEYIGNEKQETLSIQKSRQGSNSIHHNNFINNAQNAYEGYMGWYNPTQTLWDDGSAGNYWSDYTGVDEDDNGIGDTPYEIPDAGFQDIYPLMTPWDITPPVITDVAATPEIQSTNATVSITCNVIDNIGVNTVNVHITGPEGFILDAPMNEGSGYFYDDVYTTFGVYYYYIRANDSKGNTVFSDTFSFVITEFEKPVSAVAPLPTWKKVVPFVITATAYDNIGIANVTLYSRYSINGTVWTAWTPYGVDFSSPWSWSFTGSDGYYEFYSIATDTLENVEDAPSTADASTGIDTTKPVTTILLNGVIGENGWYVSNSVTITLTAIDTLSGVESTWYKVDAGYWTLYGTPFIVSGNGMHTIQYYSFDEAGNTETTKSATVKIDTTPPSTTYELDGIMGSDDQYASDVTVTINASDASSGVNHTLYNLDNGGWTTYGNPFVVTADGDHTLLYYSVDLAGNIEQTNEADFTIQHDVLPPVTTHVFDGTPGENGWYVSPTVVSLTAVDDSSGVAFTMYKVDDDVEWHDYTGSFSVTEDGEHAIAYYSVDRVGNEETPFNAELKIDKTKPSIDLTATAQNILKTKWLLVANVSDDTSGVVRVDFYVASVLVGNATTAPYEFLYEGTDNPAQAIVYDAAGNTEISNEAAVTAYEVNSQQQSIPLAHMFMVLKNI